MKFKLFKNDGTSNGEKEVNDFPTLEEGKGIDALRQAIIAVHANQRQGNASTKVRSEVRGSGKKIYRQKGLGVGRAGDKKAIQRRGGGVSFGPKPRSYTQKLNKKIKRLAMERALIDQANAENIVLIDDWKVSEPKTNLFKNLIGLIAPNSKKILAIGDSFETNFVLAARNLPTARLSRAQDLSPLDIVQSDQIVFSLKGLDILIAKFGVEGK
ncbi:MAG: 50S ribosomal protein L4 [Opitutae bacterium]|jgi:large subunit ribosomal protein L4|nr:50S ribosomal protein L4 [Opitutae bacterium]